jgi:hypothetical protein
MKRITMFACLTLVLMVATAFGADRNVRDYKFADGKYDGVGYGEVVNASKAKVDTCYVLGGPGGDGKGDFENFGAPTADGWTSIDLTELETQWHVDTYNCANLDPTTVPNHAWWCGSIDFPSCGGGDPVGGYGNGWNEWLNYQATVDPAFATNVTVKAILNYDNEIGFDFGFLEYETTAGWQAAGGSFNGVADSVVVNRLFTYNIGDYVGDSNNEINIRWRFTSDGAWSDGDCLNPTAGAMQIDQMEVWFGATQVSFEDNEGVTNDWITTIPPFVGDFAKVWPLLTDIDACRTDNSPQYAFIDDGVVIPETGGYPCTTWCYGPGGYIVNPEGGLAGPDFYIYNNIRSPIEAWCGAQYDGAQLRFTVYRHFYVSGGSETGLFYVWGIRSTDSMDPNDIKAETFADRGFVYYGGPDYIRIHQGITDLLVQGRQYVQAELGVYEIGYIWGFTSTDGAPAPYFDNVNIVTYEFGGPGIAFREIDTFQDNFPEIGVIDYANLGENSIRLDCAQNIAPQDDLWNDPGDSIWFDITVVRTGAVLNDAPKLYYKLDPNPLFDPYRSYPNDGWVYGDSTFTAAGPAVVDRWNFDLPDTGFFFPGDQLHYYIEAQDFVGTIGTTILPGDTTGWNDFSGTYIYRTDFTVRGLPTLKSTTTGDHPKILFWNDFANRGNAEEAWMFALNNLGYNEREQYDVFYTNGPSSGVGDGLGGRATDLQLSGYETLLYSLGDLSSFGMSNGDPENDAGNDIAVVDAWLRQGNKNMFATGDNFVTDLATAGTSTQAFLADWIHVDRVAKDIRPLIGNQAAPTVKPMAGNPVFGDFEWIAFGGCLGFNEFDAVNIQVDAVKLAEFLNPAGGGGAYTYSAATLYSDATYSNEIITLPYDLHFIYEPATNAKTPPTPSAARARVLEEVLLYFGYTGGGTATDVTPAAMNKFAVYPNPFNPSTKIQFNSAKATEATISIFNVRGTKVATVYRGRVDSGLNTFTWNGTDDSGRQVGSGVYFAVVDSKDFTSKVKVTLLK